MSRSCLGILTKLINWERFLTSSPRPSMEVSQQRSNSVLNKKSLWSPATPIAQEWLKRPVLIIKVRRKALRRRNTTRFKRRLLNVITRSQISRYSPKLMYSRPIINNKLQQNAALIPSALTTRWRDLRKLLRQFLWAQRTTAIKRMCNSRRPRLPKMLTIMLLSMGAVVEQMRQLQVLYTTQSLQLPWQQVVTSSWCQTNCHRTHIHPNRRNSLQWEVYLPRSRLPPKVKIHQMCRVSTRSWRSAFNETNIV